VERGLLPVKGEKFSPAKWGGLFLQDESGQADGPVLLLCDVSCAGYSVGYYEGEWINEWVNEWINEWVKASDELTYGEVVRQVNDQEERDEGEGVPGVRGDMRTHSVHIPRAHHDDHDEAEEASGLGRAARHGKELQRRRCPNHGVYRIKRSARSGICNVF
jgi:hypothetical protein